MKQHSNRCSCILYLIPVFICLMMLSAFSATAQQGRDEQRKLKEAQKQAMEQLKQMGVDIDPDKKMTPQEIQQLKNKILNKAEQLKQQLPSKLPGAVSYPHRTIDISKVPSRQQMIQIASRFYKRSYQQLKPAVKIQFDLDYKSALKDSFSFTALRKLVNKGSELISFGSDHHSACVYLTSVVKAKPDDTLGVNNFAAYLRIIDSVSASLPVLLYANQLYGTSPVILTQTGYTLLELNDDKKAEIFFKQALKIDASFGPAHAALVEVYIRQRRLKEAITELFAGVKNMGVSYAAASNSFNYLQQQADMSDTKEDFWNETGKQVKPEDVLAPLVPNDNRIEMPEFPNCVKHADWMEGGGYAAAVEAFQRFHKTLKSFNDEFKKVHSELPNLPAGAVLRDFPNERFALDCITEYFMQQSAQESKKHQEEVDKIRQQMSEVMDVYMQKHERYIKQYMSCAEGCGTNAYCIEECHRLYCVSECPTANETNSQLQQLYDKYLTAFKQTHDEQKKLLDDLFAFTDQWFYKIQSPYWSKIYAYEIRRVALAIIGACYGAYPQAFVFPVHNDCGTDCSAYVNPYPIPPGETEKKDPKNNECPEDSKHILHLFFCEAALTCEYWEVGCTEGLSASVRRNFGEHKSTTVFIGAGVEAGLGAVGGSAKFGGQVTVSDDGKMDAGFRGSVSGTLKVGKNGYNGAESEYTLTIMGGLKTETMKTSTKGFGE